MEEIEFATSMLPYLPLELRSSKFLWPSATVEALEAMSRGPEHSRVESGKVLAMAVSHMRCASEPFLAPFAPEGYALFFDELMSREDAEEWFKEVIPFLANLLLRLPKLLEDHWKHAYGYSHSRKRRVKTGLRILDRQQAGMVILSRELIAALLACSFFSLFPVTERGSKHLPMINFDNLFANLYESYDEKQESKMKCITRYFHRISSTIPVGVVSFERKVLPLEGNSLVPYGKVDFWSKSAFPLCHLEVHDSGLMEDHSGEALQVDFANKYIGGGALNRGCVQEEILFMINPELIVGMLFLPALADNEAIVIVGTERFSNYTGYASSFKFSGDYIDKRDTDCMGRHRTRIVAIDALCRPGIRQYKSQLLLREINKAFCGFSDDSKYQLYERVFQENCLAGLVDGQVQVSNHVSGDDALLQKDPATFARTEGGAGDKEVPNAEALTHIPDDEDNIGVVTGNWGCGAFGGDPELKSMIQWLAASQALRPFISYYTFGVEALQNLRQVSRWILLHGWTVGDLWNMMVEYSSQRFKQETKLGFFAWLLPSVTADDAMTFNALDAT
ncbi:poly(ADP-ribose) glycohydrolase 1-like isoform X1 [Syzygium oleosum]|uniref:poly(ADP-ribose) glycohydrolase 1-like isoform X1 n=1 Tax=Syzygium oleosum TaxID=219896 RepID=UPI0024BBC1E2|nr:poly(ADP-ribose) glycohydrolase 1-like isoform X1 [Syzygium oleosum]